MKRDQPNLKFPVGLLLIFLPAGACGYYVYGAEVDPNILKSLTDGVPKTIGLALIAAHVFLALLVLFFFSSNDT